MAACTVSGVRHEVDCLGALREQLDRGRDGGVNTELTMAFIAGANNKYISRLHRGYSAGRSLGMSVLFCGLEATWAVSQDVFGEYGLCGAGEGGELVGGLIEELEAGLTNYGANRVGGVLQGWDSFMGERPLGGAGAEIWADGVLRAGLELGTRCVSSLLGDAVTYESYEVAMGEIQTMEPYGMGLVSPVVVTHVPFGGSNYPVHIGARVEAARLSSAAKSLVGMVSADERRLGDIRDGLKKLNEAHWLVRMRQEGGDFLDRSMRLADTELLLRMSGISVGS